MSQEYYIDEGGSQKGPYDLVMIVRKIRNKSLMPTALVSQSQGGKTMAAQDWPELKELFKVAEEADSSKRGHTKYTLIGLLSNGWDLIKRTPICTLYSGIFVLIVVTLLSLLGLILPSFLYVVGYTIGFICSYFLLSLYIFSVLRMARGQPIDLDYLLEKALPVFRSLLPASVIITLPALIGLAIFLGFDSPVISFIGLVIFTLPGLFMLTLCAFAPLFIIDQNQGPLDAIKKSYAVVAGNGVEFIGVVFALFAINAIAGFTIILLVMTLPITMHGIAEIYDEIQS